MARLNFVLALGCLQINRYDMNDHVISCSPRQHLIMQQMYLISAVSIFVGSSSDTYTRGSFAHQLKKELDNIVNQRNKLGKHLYYVTQLIYFVYGP